MYFVASLTVLSIMLLALCRAFLGPTLFDRILAMNMFGTKTVLLVSIIGVASSSASFLDIALVYALINFIGVLAVLRFIDYTRQDIDRERKSGES